MADQVKSALLETLRAVDTAQSHDVSFLFAATTNLYIESIRRLHARVMLRPDDINNIFNFIENVIHAKVVEDYASTGRSRELTQKEREGLLGAVEADLRK